MIRVDKTELRIMAYAKAKDDERSARHTGIAAACSFGAAAKGDEFRRTPTGSSPHDSNAINLGFEEVQVAFEKLPGGWLEMTG